MASLVDQRISIPLPVHAVWSVLADQAQLQRWRVDCQTVQILSARQFGVGTRRRCIPPHGSDKIEEISAWFEGIGYEYRLTENRSYKEWIGRIRLQAIPEGTIVQWTITYEMRGLLGRLLNFIGGRAQLEEDCGESLRRLRHWAESNYLAAQGESAKRRQTLQPIPSIVRSSTQPIIIPPQDAAADTKPRKPIGLEDVISSSAPPTTPSLESPAVQTDPIAAYAAPTDPKPPTPTPIPAVVATPSESSAYTAPTDPKPPTPTPIPAVKTPTPPPIAKSPTAPTPSQPQAAVLPPGMPEILKVTPPQGTPKVDISRLRFADEVNTELDLTAPRDAGDTGQTQAFRPGLPPPTSPQDTGEISIWDAFGLSAPSKMDAQALAEVVKTTGEFKPVIIEPSAKEGDTVVFSPLYKPQRLKIRPADEAAQEGLTIQQARKKAQLRSWWMFLFF